MKKENTLTNRVLDLAVKYNHTYIDTAYVCNVYERDLIDHEYKGNIEQRALQKTERYLSIFHKPKPLYISIGK